MIDDRDDGGRGGGPKEVIFSKGINYLLLKMFSFPHCAFKYIY